MRVLPIVLALMATYTSQGILARLSQEDGKYTYNTNVAVTLSEVLKFCWSFFLVSRQESEPVMVVLKQTHSVHYAVPAVLYAVHNLLQYTALRQLTAPSYQLFCQMKLIATALVFRLIINRALTVVQWVGIVLLAAGVAVTKVGIVCDAAEADPEPLAGFLTVLVIALCSALAGVYNEHLLKSKGAPLQAANCHLYIYGVLTLFVCLLFEAGFKLSPDMLGGFNTAAVCLVISNAAIGQVVSLLLKYADNIVKVFATSSALFCTAFLSTVLFDTPFDARMMLGLIIVTASIFLYFLSADKLASKDDAMCNAFFGRGAAAAPLPKKKDVGVEDEELLAVEIGAKEASSAAS
eukprot:TRINITY_DN47320_c0_g1_i1.p1 TRINITY_DN47320_c0_g1~~TRINITY_DN47320_c0_g1_i1.p1  ORF type:complete len:350 (-),score=92.81 TRINITY_DN47320_c0_g1_i1:662-1711(-)